MAQTIDQIVEDIQEAQVLAGGRFFRRSEIESMKVKDLLELLVPNSVSFVVKVISNTVNTNKNEYNRARIQDDI